MQYNFSTERAKGMAKCETKFFQILRTRNQSKVDQTNHVMIQNKKIIPNSRFQLYFNPSLTVICLSLQTGWRLGPFSFWRGYGDMYRTKNLSYHRGTYRQFNRQRLKICFIASSLFTAMCASTNCFQYFAWTQKKKMHQK